MKPQMRRNLSGTFLPQDLGKGAWRLTRGEAPDTDVFLRGAEPNATEALRGATVSDIAIEWRSDAVVLNFTSGDGLRTLQTQSAIVHEPQSQLYEVLPLASLDDKARRFWRRVFRLVRIPGGRYLLRVLARRTRDAG
jgi:hypothetical protein